MRDRARRSFILPRSLALVASTRSATIARGAAALTAFALVELAAPRDAHAQLVDYTVRRGDTCVAIARRRYNNPRRIDLIHQHNDLGPLPHRLRPGQVLHIPLRAPSNAPTGPDARLTFLRNVVETYTPAQGRGRRNDPLNRGNRVNTLAGSSAEVTFADETQLQLGEHTLVVILGDTESQARATRRGSVQDTTLVSGALRLRLGELAGRRPLATPSGQVVVEQGESLVSVDSGRTTRVAVHAGRSRVTAQRRTVNVAAGFGTRTEPGRPPEAPRRLPPAPEWSGTPPRVLLVGPGAEGARWVADYHPGAAGPAAAQFHLQISRDRSFNDLVVDTRVASSVTQLEARTLNGGTYFAHVSAIDAEQFEGPFGEERSVTVIAPRIEAAGDAPFRARITLAEGVVCALDDAALAAQPIEYDTLTAHRLRCARADDPSVTESLELPAAQPGEFAARAELAADERTPRGAHVALTLSFGASTVFPRLETTVRAPDGVTVLSQSAGPQPGTYEAQVTCAEGTERFRLHVTAGRFEADTNELTCPQPPPVVAVVPTPSAPPPRPRPAEHPLLLGHEGEWGLGVRTWMVRIPSTFVGLFTQLQPGWRGYTGIAAGPELIRRSDNLEIHLAAQFSTYGAGLEAAPFAARGLNDPEIVQEIITARMWATYFTASFMWALRPHRMFEVQLGLGFGLGYVGGDLYRTQAYRDAGSGGYRDQSGVWRDCQQAFGPGASQPVYCNPGDSSPPHFSNGTPATGGAYREPSWLGGGSAPFILPWFSLPQVSLHFRPTRHFALRGDLGFAVLGYYAGGGMHVYF